MQKTRTLTGLLLTVAIATAVTVCSSGKISPEASSRETPKASEAEQSTTNPEVKAAAEAAHTDLTAVRDSMQKVYVDQDMGALSEFTSASANMQTSYSAVLTLCSPS